MLDEFLTDEQYEQEPVEIETTEASEPIIEKPCVKNCQNNLEENLGHKFEDKCVGCNYRYSDPSKCENC